MKKQFALFSTLIGLLVACGTENSNTFEKKKVFPVRKVAIQADGYELDSLAMLAKDGCELGVALAKADERKGIVGYYFWGIAIPPLAAVLSDKYGVQVYTRGCTMAGAQGEARSCYNDYMAQLLQRKYKQDVIALESEKLRLGAKEKGQ